MDAGAGAGGSGGGQAALVLRVAAARQTPVRHGHQPPSPSSGAGRSVSVSAAGKSHGPRPCRTRLAAWWCPGRSGRGWENPPTCPSNQCAITDPLGPAPLSAEQRPGSARWSRRCRPASARALPARPVTPASSARSRSAASGTSTIPVLPSSVPATSRRCTRLNLLRRARPRVFARLASQVRRSPDPQHHGGRPREPLARLQRNRTRRVRTRDGLCVRLDRRVHGGRDPQEPHDGSGSSAADRLRPERNTVASSTPIDLQTVETVSWMNVPGRTSYVVVDGYAGAEGSYTLEVDCACP